MANRSVDRLIGWVGLAGLDAVGRLLLQVLTTVLLARLLVPSDFGVSALVLSSVVILTIVVGGVPFEETLAQRAVVRRRHLEGALAVSWAGGAVITVLAWPIGAVLGDLMDIPGFAALLTGSCALLFSEAYSKIATAVARRRHRFSTIALAQSVGAAAGSAAAIALAFLGAGVWAILAYRLVASAATALALALALNLILLPRYRPRSLAGMGRFSSIILFDNLIDNAAYLLFNYAIGGLFGTAALGFVNMAMRVVEPLRGAIVAVTHNLAFAYFREGRADPARLNSVLTVAVRTATLTTVPAFLGLAAVAPVLIPVMAGPDWDPSIRLTELFSLGTALFLPLQMVLTAMTAIGRPHVTLLSGLSGLASLGVGLGLAVPLGVVAAGIGRLAADAMEALVSLTMAIVAFKLPAGTLAAAVALPWLIAAAMAGSVRAALPLLQGMGSAPLALVGAIVLGLAIYPALIALLQPGLIRDLRHWVRARKAAQAASGGRRTP